MSPLGKFLTITVVLFVLALIYALVLGSSAGTAGPRPGGSTERTMRVWRAGS